MNRDRQMRRPVDNDHPIRRFFADMVHETMHDGIGITDEEIEMYLADMLVDFVHQDEIYGVRSSEGTPVESVAEMIVEGDVRLNADSFEREREVHKHIGDFLLFWGGLYPEFLLRLRQQDKKDLLVDYTQQGKTSYHIVSTFDHDPFGDEAPMFGRLSEKFEEYSYGLSLVRASFEGFARQGWYDGFQA
jgi:hypothetical protein